MNSVLTKAKEKVASVKDAVVTSRGCAVLTAMATTGVMFMSQSAFAAADVKGLLETILKIISVLIIVLGLFMAIMGIVHYASASSEGNGPDTQKAIKQIAAGGMLLVLSIILFTTSGTLVGFIETSI